jgi:cytidylate kinase
MSNSSAPTDRQVDSNLFVTVSGPPGCGATTLTEGLSEALDCGYVIGGDIFRDLAEERDISLQQLIAKAEEDDSIDRALDERLRRIAEEWGAANKAFVLESRLAGWLAGNRADLRIWLDAPEEVRIDRLRDQEEVGAVMRVREVSEAGRYKSYYGIDVEDQSFYDVSLNTGRWDAETVLDIVLSAIEGYDAATDEGAFTTRDVDI